MQVKSETILLDSNKDCQTKDLIRRQIIRPFPLGTEMFVDGKRVCGGTNEILYEYVPGVWPADEPIVEDNSDPTIMRPESNGRVIGNYGSPDFSSDFETLNLFNVKYKNVCCNCVHSSPSNNMSPNNQTKNKLPDKVSEFDLTKDNITTWISDERNTTQSNIENSSDKVSLNETSQMESNRLAVCVVTSKIESDSLKNINCTTKTSKQCVTKTSTTDTQNSYLSTAIEVKKHLDSSKDDDNNINNVENPDKQLSSTMKNDNNHPDKCVFVKTTKQNQHFKPRYTTTFKKHTVLSYVNNENLLLIITRF